MEALSKGQSLLLDASGLSVGLPDGLMGNSEVGHYTIGTGRISYQVCVYVVCMVCVGEGGGGGMVRVRMCVCVLFTCSCGVSRLTPPLWCVTPHSTPVVCDTSLHPCGV